MGMLRTRVEQDLVVRGRSEHTCRAYLRAVKNERAAVVGQLTESASVLAPLFEEREQLKSDVGNLPQLKQELTEKEKLLPGQEEQRWANATAVVQAVVAASSPWARVSASCRQCRSAARGAAPYRPASGNGRPPAADG